MRTLSGDLDASLDSPALTQLWFVELVVSAQTFRRCSQVDVPSFNGYAWTQSNMVVEGPSVRAGAGMGATITLIQDDPVITSFMTESWARCTGSLYFTNFTGTTLATPVLLLSGDVSNVSLEGKQVSLTLTAGGNRSSVTPWIRIAPPLFNHLTARGTVLTWGIDKIVIDRE